jgi:hypothetical protein
MPSETLPQVSFGLDKKVTVERRVEVRYTRRRTSFARPAGGSRSAVWVATVRDISANGIGLLLRHRVRTGAVISLQPLGKNQAKRVHALVVRAQAVDGGYFHGCELTECLSEQDLREWLV